MRISCCKIGGGIIVGFVDEGLVGWFIGGLVDWFFGGVVVGFAGGLVGWFVGGLIVVRFVGGIVVAPRFKFGMNPPLIDGILNVLPYELVSYKGYEKPKKWSMYSSNCKIFCDLYKGIP